MNKGKNQSEGIRASANLRRRDFLKILASSFAAITLEGCKLRPPKERILPYLEQPEEFGPGMATHYASTCTGCPASCGVLVKCRDGRPIKMEGNPEHPLSRGGLCAQGQALILDLYDSERYRGPAVGDAPSRWASVDRAVIDGLAGARNIRLVTQSLPSPSLRAAIAVFEKRFPGARRVVYDPVSNSAILDAHLRTHGRRVQPHYRFAKAKAIVGFDADFLGTWISPVEFTRDWASNRVPQRQDGGMSWHAQFEPRMSVTGANADLRVPLKPSEEFSTVSDLAARIADRAAWKGRRPPAVGSDSPHSESLDRIADVLIREKRSSLVVSGSNHIEVQILVNWINEMLGNYGRTLDLEVPSDQPEGSDAALAGLVVEMRAGRVDALVVLGANPAYDNALAKEFSEAMGHVKLTISTANRPDETSRRCGFVCPDHHPLESWGDAEPVSGILSIAQPVLAPMFDTRGSAETLLNWAGNHLDGYDFLKTHWKTAVYPRVKPAGSFQAFWDESLRRGSVEAAPRHAPQARFSDLGLSNLRLPAQSAGLAGSFEFVAYAGVALAGGRQANNPWLQELPDPISKAAWGNFASFSRADAKRLGIVEGRVVKLVADGAAVELPAHIQPGMPNGVVAAALGYGREGAGKIAANYPMEKMLPVEKDLLAGADVFGLSRAGAVGVSVTGRLSLLAKTQTYDYLEEPFTGRKRPIIQDMTLDEFQSGSASRVMEANEESSSLWSPHRYEGHKWAMAIDLSLCTGCSACVVACQAENNVPVVGKAEVRSSRDMQWLRIDRYYSCGPDAEEESPDVAFQPMMCQHCDNAPCETVCPVLATVHSSEGLNMQVYNRCVGTRYCANNCPYKVRRFNWFDYAHQDLLQNMALNPDITVRTRGVMEKCSFCVQRIAEAKAAAKQDGRNISDGDVRPACMSSCPAGAIVFGDINDPESRVGKLSRDPRRFQVLGELGVGPSTFYLKKVRNKKV